MLRRDMPKFDADTARAWAIVMDKISELRDEDETLERIGKRLGVGRNTVSRWLSQNSGGERNTFGEIIRYMRALDIPLHAVFPELQTPEYLPTALDKAIAKTVQDTALALGYTPEKLAPLLSPPTTTEHVHRMFTGTTCMSGGHLLQFCRLIGVSVETIANRAQELTREKSERSDTLEHTAARIGKN